MVYDVEEKRALEKRVRRSRDGGGGVIILLVVPIKLMRNTR